MITITKRFRFEAAHKLKNYIGKCANLHGHSYKVDATFARKDFGFDNITGMVIDFHKLESILEHFIGEEYDHHDITEFFGELPATAEVIAYTIGVSIMESLNRVLERLSDFEGEIDIIEVKVWETDDSYATWTNDYYTNMRR